MHCAKSGRITISSYPSRLFALVELINLLRGESEFGDYIGVSGVAVEGVGLRGNIEAVFLAETVEIILHMEAVHTLGGTADVVILTAVVAVDGEAILEAMAHCGLAKGDEAIAAGEGVYVHLVDVAICALLDLAAHLSALPLKPIGDMGELGFAAAGGELAVFFHKPALAALLAEYLRAFGGHLELGMAMGALVEHLLQSLGAVSVGDEDIVFQLIAVFVILHGFGDYGVDLLGAHLLHLLGGEHLTEHGAVGDFVLVLVGPEGGVEVVAVVGDNHQRDFVHLHQSAKGVRQEGCGADGGVACLGVHAQYVAVLDYAADGFDEVKVGGEFAGADGAYPCQQPGHHVVAVDVYNVVHLSRVGHHGGQLKVDEGLMVAEDDVGGLQTLHVDGFKGVFLADEADFGQNPDDPCEPRGLSHGIFRGFVIFLPAVINFHV